jgi:hypothetical protein
MFERILEVLMRKIVKISDNKKRPGFAEWVVIENGKSITVHDTEANVKKRFRKTREDQ